MFSESALVGMIIFWDLGIEMNKIFILSAEELEFEFIIDLGNWIHPVHLEVIIFIGLDEIDLHLI